MDDAKTTKKKPIEQVRTVRLHLKELEHRQANRKQVEKALRFSNHFLEKANLQTGKSALLDGFVEDIQKFTECEAVGIRLLDENFNIPYESYTGFSKEFYKRENPLTTTQDKCMCINVITGQTDSKLKFYTEGGSFYMNGTTDFLATVSEEDKGQSRNVCNEFGYESVAVIPIRTGNSVYGAIHIADSNKNKVPLSLVEILEKIAIQISSAISRVNAEEQLEKYALELENKVEKRTKDLGERIKELNCLYGLSQLTKRGDITLEEIFQELAELIPAGWRYPEITAARITFEDRSFKTSNFRKTTWMQSANIEVHGQKAGIIEICYLKKRPVIDEGPFLKEERNLIDGISRALSEAIERRQAEENLLSYQKKLRSLASQLSLSEENQRRQIATNLHDHVNQGLALSMFKLQSLRKSAHSEDSGLLDTVCETISNIIENVHGLTFDLGSPTLYKFGLEAAISELLEEQFRENREIIYEYSDDKSPKPLNDDVRALLFQSIRELLINIIKHSRAQKVLVAVGKNEDNIQITVSDDGVGFDVDNIEPLTHKTGGFGLFNIQERLDYIGGSFEIQSQPGNGSRFVLSAPLKTETDLPKEKSDGNKDSTG